MRSLSIYIHIPFCLQKCLYCDFLSAPAGEPVREQYVQALCAEMQAEAEHYREYRVKTVFLGGGTPSVLSGKQIGRILSCLYGQYAVDQAAEITMEANPGTVTADQLSACREAGVDRLSLGLQSADNQELRELGRIHTWEEFLESYEMARQTGFQNINIDLMSALPGQTMSSYMHTLQSAAALQPEHISAYSLIIEEGTPFYEMYGGNAEEAGGWAPQSGQGGRRALPDEETDRAMYEATKRFLAEQGYGRYEISNYARAGKACAHNCVYWTRGEYAGFGLGAASMVGNVRWSNVRELAAYLSAPAGEKKTDRVHLSVREQMEETMYLGLRMMRGVSKADFYRTFGRSMEEVYGHILKKHEKAGLLTDGDCVCLTDKGIDVSNYVLADFLLK